MKKDKETLIKYFQDMKALEESARDYYLGISNYQGFENQEVKDSFRRISGDEQRHSDMLEKIIDIIKTNNKFI